MSDAMFSKQTLNLAVSLFIAAAGVKVLMVVTDRLLPAESGIDIEQIGNVFIIALVFFGIILIPFYLSQRSDERKGKQ